MRVNNLSNEAYPEVVLPQTPPKSLKAQIFHNSALKFRFPFPRGKGLGVRFFESFVTLKGALRDFQRPEPASRARSCPRSFLPLALLALSG